MDEIYNITILRWATRIPHRGKLVQADVSVSKKSRICGSRMSLDACLKDGRIDQVSIEVEACALGQATAAIVGQHMIGLDETELKGIKARFSHMIKTGEINFPEKWQDLADLAPVKDLPGRHGSVMLPFDCLEAVFEKASSSKK